MNFSRDAPWLQSFVLASAVERAGRATEFYRAVRSGRFIRLAHGVYLPRETWLGLNSDERFLATLHAVQRSSRRPLVFSHLSAAALWGLPSVGAWPTKAEVVAGSSGGGRSRVGYTARAGSIPSEPALIDGLAVTPLPQTLLDVAHSAPLVTSVAMLDFALRRRVRGETGLSAVRASRPHLAREVEASTRVVGRTRCARSFDLCDGMSGSPGESLSRVGIHLLGLPAPELQVPFRDAKGLIGYVDFWWPGLGLIGEFDGFGKYLRAELLNGQSTADAVVAEKLREDRLRATGPRVVRWGWDEARKLPLLERRLRNAGLA